MWAAQRWASGASLQTVLREGDLTAGDFVRWTKQVIDLLGQVAVSADEPVRGAALEAVDRMTRGVVRTAMDM